MIRNKLTLGLLIFSLVGLSPLAFSGEEKLDDFLSVKLGLDDGRAEQVKQILTEAREAAKVIREKHKAEMQDHRAGVKSQLSTILTEEEMQAFEESKKRKFKRESAKACKKHIKRIKKKKQEDSAE